MLLAAVLCIWGAIIFKIIKGLSLESPKLTSEKFDVAFKPNELKAKDKFFICKVDRDPFLGTLSNSEKKKIVTKSSKTNIKPIINNLNITYNGSIKKNNSSDQVFVVNISNKQYLLKKGQIADSVKIVNGDSKKIIVSFRNKLQTIKRQL